MINTEYRKTLADLQSQGMDYISALNFVPGVTDVQKNIEVQTLQEIAQPDIVEQKQATVKIEKRENIFKRVIREIERKILSRRYRKKDDEGLDYI